MLQFSPIIYPEWGELILDLSVEEQAAIFNAILKYPNVEINSGIWRFIKSQIDKDYEKFQLKCRKNKENSRNYWANKTNKKPNDIARYRTISNDIPSISNDIPSISNDIPKPKPKPKPKPIPPLISPPTEKMFEEFWGEYIPVKADGKAVCKGSKLVAKKSFEKAIKAGANPDDMRSGLKKYLSYCAQNNLLTCSVSTFLNQQRWKDDYGGDDSPELPFPSKNEDLEKQAKLAELAKERIYRQALQKFGKT